MTCQCLCIHTCYFVDGMKRLFYNSLMTTTSFVKLHHAILLANKDVGFFLFPKKKDVGFYKEVLVMMIWFARSSSVLLITKVTLHQ